MLALDEDALHTRVVYEDVIQGVGNAEGSLGLPIRSVTWAGRGRE